MKVKEYLNITDNVQYHVFDSHQEGMIKLGKEHRDQDYVYYTYNVHRNNRPKAGDVFLYRRPGKSSKTRKFYIYGGGVIKSISSPDKNGDVHAEITKPFKLSFILEQGDAYLEGFKWKFKERPEGSWLRFWNQYGMNVICKEDFFNLVGDLDCTIPQTYTTTQPSIIEAAEENEVVPVINKVTFSADDESLSKFNKKTGKRKLKVTNIDFSKQHLKNMKLGELGELMVVELLKENMDSSCDIEHSSKVIGDGLGYDIKLTFSYGKTIYIEVKTTKANCADGFYITPNEQRFAQQCGEKEEYFIYRVYNFKEGTASLKIYNGPISESEFNLVPTAFKVYAK